MDKLKPCPFCGGEAKVEHEYYSNFTKINYCVSCFSCFSSTFDFDTEQEAIEAWNRRVGEE